MEAHCFSYSLTARNGFLTPQVEIRTRREMRRSKYRQSHDEMLNKFTLTTFSLARLPNISSAAFLAQQTLELKPRILGSK